MCRMKLSVALTVGLVLLTASCVNQSVKTAPGALPRESGDQSAPRVQSTTYFAHGHLLERQGNFEQAAEQYRMALEAKPDFVTARNRLGITLNKLGRHPEATAEFRRALTQTPNLAYLHNNLGFSLYLEGDFNGAEGEFARALQVNPGFARARMNHALALAKLERLDDAFAEFRLAGDEAAAHYNMAMIHADAHRYEEAVRSLDLALRVNPQFEAAREQLRVLGPLALNPTVSEVQTSSVSETQTASVAAPQTQNPPIVQTSDMAITDVTPPAVQSAAPAPVEAPPPAANPAPPVHEQAAAPVTGEQSPSDPGETARPPAGAPLPPQGALRYPLPPLVPGAGSEIAPWPLLPGARGPRVLSSYDLFEGLDVLSESSEADRFGPASWEDYWRQFEARVAAQTVSRDPLSAAPESRP